MAVFLLLGGIFYVTRWAEGNTLARSHVLAQRLAGFDRTAIIAAEAVRDTQALYARAQDFIEIHFPPCFDVSWARRVKESVPDGAEMLTLDWNGTAITLVAAAQALSDVSIHQENLRKIDAFAAVTLGSITQWDDGRFRYEIRLTMEDME